MNRSLSTCARSVAFLALGPAVIVLQQALVLEPGANLLQVIASNAAHIVIGGP